MTTQTPEPDRPAAVSGAGPEHGPRRPGRDPRGGPARRDRDGRLGAALRNRRVEQVVRYRADPNLARTEAAERTSAYVYGNILLFAALVPLSHEAIESGHAILILAVLLSEVYLLVRMALIGFVVARLGNRTSVVRILLGGVAAAGVAAAIAILKVATTH